MDLTPRQERAIQKLTDTAAGAICGALLWVIVWSFEDDFATARLFVLLSIGGAALGLLFGDLAIRPARRLIVEWWEKW